MTDLSNLNLPKLPASELHTIYTQMGGTKSLKSFKNKSVIVSAILDLHNEAEASSPIADRFEEHATGNVELEQHDDHVHTWHAGPAEVAEDDIPEGYETSEGEVGRWVQTDNGPVWEPLNAAEDVADEEEDAPVPAGRITEKLSKVQRAKLRKLLGGKLTEGRWTDMVLAVSILEQVGCRYKLVD